MDHKEPVVISASRRTDLPAYYTPWLLERLREGRCRYRHPFTGRSHEVLLTPDAVRAIVFWSKNMGPLLPHLDSIARLYPVVCHLTITGYPRLLEPGAPPAEQAIEQALTISGRYGPERVLWRFDPVIITPASPWDRIEASFRQIASRLEGATSRCYFSFVHLYGTVRRRLARQGIAYVEPSLSERVERSQALAAIAREHGISLLSCCGDDLVQGLVGKARCVDPEVLVAAGAQAEPPIRPAATRHECGCYRSTDIGAYGTCRSGCVFCYAGDLRPPRPTAGGGDELGACATLQD